MKVMVSIINKATKIISKIGKSIAEYRANLHKNDPLFAEEVAKQRLDYPLNFISCLGKRGTYVLFILIVLLVIQGKAQNLNTPNKNGPMGTQVNTFTGNLYIPRNDIFISARGINMNISFSYNTFNYKQNIGYGNGWSFNYAMFYRLDAAGVVTIVQGDDREDIYTPSTGGTFTSLPGIFDNLTQYQTGKYLLQTKYGMKYYFDNSTHKRVTKMQDPNGNSLTFTYSDTLVTAITNSVGQTITLNYSGGLLSSVVDAIASPTRTYSYAYDGYGNLIKVTDPLAKTIKYTYLVNGPLSSITDKNGNTADVIYNIDFTVSELIGCNSRKSFSYDTISKTTVVTDYVPTSQDQTTTYNYSSFTKNGLTKTWLTHITGNCCGFNLSFTYDNNGNLLTKTDANGNIYTFTYDNVGNLLSITDPLGQKSTYTYSADFNQITSYTNPNGNSYSINYDSRGNPIQLNEPNNIVISNTYSSFGDITSSTDARGSVYNFSYDANGNPAQVTGPLNYKSSFVFDGRGNLKSLSDANNNTYTIQYDLLDRATLITDPMGHTIVPTYDAADNMISIKDQNGHIKTYAYDASNRMVVFIDALGKQSHYAYDALNNLVSHQDRLGNTTIFNYDNLNRMSAMIDALGNAYTYNYDPNGNIKSITYPNGNTLNYTYDKLDRIVSSTDLNGTRGSILYDKNSNVTSYTNPTGATVSALYDGLNRITKVIDPQGNATKFVFDANTNVTSITDRNNHSCNYVFDALNRATSFTDNNGLTTSVGYDPAGNILSLGDQKNNSTTYNYDVLNRPIKTTYADGSFLGYGYDNAGNMLSRTLADGNIISYQYNAANMPISKTVGSNNFNYTYDDIGRLKTAANNAGTISLNYDAINRLTSETFSGHSTTYNYNTGNRTTTITYPDGTTVVRKYDIRNKLQSISKGSSLLAAYKYTDANQVQQLTYGNGVSTNMIYDNTNHLNKISTTTDNLENISLAYDGEQNLTMVTRASFPQASEQINYDAEYRMTGYKQGAVAGASIPSPILQNTYAFDAVGNRTTAVLNGQNNTYTTNNLNRYTQVNNGSQNITYTYDNNGNLLFDGSFYKRYDIEGKLLVDSTATQKIQYLYDAFGRRVQKSSGSAITNYYYSKLSQIEQRDGNNDTLLNETIFSGAFTPIMGSSKQQTYYYHQNHLNSVESISNSQGNLLERYQYDPYGKTTIYDANGNVLTASLVNNRFAFTGQEYDAETSNYHFLYRNYSTTTGSFYQKDPLGYGDGMGVYLYAHNNPSTKIDLLGLNIGDGSDTPQDASNVSGNAVAAAGLEYERQVKNAEQTVEAMEQQAANWKSGNLTKFGEEMAARLRADRTEKILNAEKNLARAGKFSTALGKIAPWLNTADLAYKIYKSIELRDCFGNPIKRDEYAQMRLNIDVMLAGGGYNPVIGTYNLLDYGVELTTGKSATTWELDAGEAHLKWMNDHPYLSAAEEVACWPVTIPGYISGVTGQSLALPNAPQAPESFKQYQNDPHSGSIMNRMP